MLYLATEVLLDYDLIATGGIRVSHTRLVYPLFRSKKIVKDGIIQKKSFQDQTLTWI